MADAVYADPPGKICTNDWKITGYYVPVETDFEGKPKLIEVEGFGTSDFAVTFLTEVITEGWGKTRFGWYLGWNAKIWQKSDIPLNAVGTALVKGQSLAVDRSVVHLRTEVFITNAPPPWNQTAFIADDTGGDINGQHLDIFCGEGAAAKQETYRVTYDTGRVCK